MGDASEVCIQEPVEERIPKAIAEGKPCNGKVNARRNLRNGSEQKDNNEKCFCIKNGN